MDRYGVDAAVVVSGFPRGTLGTMVHRRHAPSFPYSPQDLCSLLLAKELVDRGLRTEAACAIAWAVRDEWREVILADGAAGNSVRYVAVAPTPPGDPVPFCWMFGPSDDDLLAFLEVGAERGPTFLVHATQVCRTVFTRLLEHLRSRGDAPTGQLTGSDPWSLGSIKTPAAEASGAKRPSKVKRAHR